ncbi:MAG: hypothetical protein FWG13_03740 [Leptospirales bacterium]|nr:hypothetical protein [Leptospirales bacterium]
MISIAKITAAALVLLIILPAYGFAGENVFKAMKLSGLKNISRHDILKNAGIRVSGEEIICDVDILKESLAKNNMIESFLIEFDGKSVLVSVKEKPVIAAVAVVTPLKTVPLILGENFTVLGLSKNCAQSPLFIVTNREVTGNTMSAYFQKVYGLIKETETAYQSLYNEIEEVSLLKPDFLEIRLKGRPVLCRMKAEFQNLRRLNYIVGYMDASRRYPEVLDIDSDSAVIR